MHFDTTTSYRDALKKGTDECPVLQSHQDILTNAITRAIQVGFHVDDGLEQENYQTTFAPHAFTVTIDVQDGIVREVSVAFSSIAVALQGLQDGTQLRIK